MEFKHSRVLQFVLPFLLLSVLLAACAVPPSPQPTNLSPATVPSRSPVPSLTAAPRPSASPTATPTATPQNPCAGFDVLSIPPQERVQFQDDQLAQIGSGRMCDITAKTLTFSPDGNSLALAAYDGIRLYDAYTGELRLRMKPGETGQTWSAAFSPDGRFLAAISTWGDVTLWDISTGALLQSLNKPGEAASAPQEWHSAAMAGAWWHGQATLPAIAHISGI